MKVDNNGALIFDDLRAPSAFVHDSPPFKKMFNNLKYNLI
jgi:hypothetical protein